MVRNDQPALHIVDISLFEINCDDLNVKQELYWPFIIMLKVLESGSSNSFTSWKTFSEFDCHMEPHISWYNLFML